MKRFPLLLAGLIATGCGKDAHGPMGYAVRVPAAGFQQQQAAISEAPALYRQARDESATKRMVTRSAEIRAVVAHPESTSATLAAAVQASGGFVEDARQWRASGQMLASLTLRVPDDRLATTLDAIRHVAIRVDNEGITGEDVTAEYTDLGAQLKNLQATETELRSLLVTVGQRTKRASDVLDVFNKLTEVRGEIDQTQARMGTLSKLAALATIKVDLVPDALSEPITAGGWRPVVTVRGAFADLVGTLRWMVDALIWVLVYVVPVIVAVGAPVLGTAALARSWRRRWATVRIP